MYAIFVTLNVQQDKIAEFEEGSLGDTQGSTRDEPECFRFDILRDPRGPGPVLPLRGLPECRLARETSGDSALPEVVGDGRGLVRGGPGQDRDRDGVSV